MAVQDLRFLKASDGTGSANTLTVSLARTVGSTTLKVSTISKWPAYFIATTGQVNANGYVVESTKQEFRGHLSGSDIIIDGFQPGFTDTGTPLGYVVILKQSTGWADNIVDSVRTVLKDADSTLKDGIVPATALAANAVTTAKIADGSVSFSKLLSNIFSGQLLTQTNSGSAGGTFNYVNIGGIKMLWIESATQGFGAGAAPQTFAVSFTLPSGFFTATPFVLPQWLVVSNTQYIYTSIDSKSASTVTVNVNEHNGTSGTGKVELFAIGP